MPELQTLLDQVEDKKKPAVEHLLQYLRREQGVRSLDTLAKVGPETFDAALKEIAARNPFLELESQSRAALVQQIQQLATRLAQLERERIQKRRARPTVALDDFSRTLSVPYDLQDAWKAAGISALQDLLTPVAAKAISARNLPLTKRREILAVTKLTLASNNLRLSETLYKAGFTSFSRLARIPKKRLGKTLTEARLDADDLEDAFEIQRRARVVHRQSQNLAIGRGSTRYNFGPPPAFYDPQPDLGKIPGLGGLLDLNIEPIGETNSCATCSECENTLSPLAYLFDLLDFINDQWGVTTGNLETVLLQKIRELDCEVANATTTQIRIAIKVLEKFIGGQILRTDAEWQARYKKTADLLVRLMSQTLELNPVVTNVAELSGDQRFAANQPVQTFIAALSAGSPALAELDAVESALRTIVVAHVASAYPLPAEPVNPTDDQTIAFLIERSRQEQNREVDQEQFEKQLALVIEAAYVDYRKLLIKKTAKSTKELENLLFIHLTGAPCHQTTPITQLILSLQAFVLAIRTGEMVLLQQTPQLAAIIGNGDFSSFDEETWSWLETYAKWSSAMYAFSYPENVMGLPTLRNPMSPAFRKAVESLSVSSSASMVDDALQSFEDELKKFQSLRLLSAHVVNRQLYIFASHDSSAIWMNTVDIQTQFASGWQVMFAGDSHLLPYDVAPHYRDREVRFLAAFYHIQGWATFDEIRLKWLKLDGSSESGPEVPSLQDTSSVSGLTLGLEWYSNQLLTYLKWVSDNDAGALTEVKDTLSPDGSWWRQKQPTNNVFGTREVLVADRKFRAQNFREDSVTVLSVTSNEAHDFEIRPLYQIEGNDLSPWYHVAGNPDSLQTYLVAMPEQTWPGVSAFAPIDLEAMAFANEWRALSAAFNLSEADYATLNSSSNGALPLSVNNLYVEERHLHFPLLAAWSLNRSGDYANAHDWLLSLYNPFQPTNREKFPFRRFFSGNFVRPEVWLGEPLNPHNLGRQRSGVYLRHVILTMVKNLLDWGDHEFSLNNIESRHRAEELYRLARQVLAAPDLGNPCQEGLMSLEFEIGQRYRLSANDVFSGLDNLSRRPNGRQIIEELGALIRAGEPLDKVRRKGQKRIDSSPRSATTKFSELEDSRQRFLESSEGPALTSKLAWLERESVSGKGFLGTWVASLALGTSAQSITLRISRHSDLLQGTLQGKPLDSLTIDLTTNSIEFRQKSKNLAFRGSLRNDQIDGGASSIDGLIRKHLTFKRQRRDPDFYDFPDFTIEPVTVSLCVPSNPLLASFDSHITIGLLALDQCRLISGELQPPTRFPVGSLQDSTATILDLMAGGSSATAIASDQPRYRFGYLNDQARQRAALSKQLGDALVGALREKDQASYDLLLAENARGFAGANRELKELVRSESRDAKLIADTQSQRADSNQTFWKDRIASNPDGMSKIERDALGLLSASGWLQFSAAMINFVMALPAGLVAGAGAALSTASAAATLGSGTVAAPVTIPGWVIGTMGVSAGLLAGGQQIAGGLQGLGGALGTWANEQLTRASFARRWEEWNLQNTLANFDAQIAQQQVTLAQDRIDISDKDYEIAGLQYVHAQRVYEFLQNKTLNKELYEWMVSVLIEQYRAVMQSATAVAQLAQRALEFEWQAPVTIVKGDYWTIDAPSLREDQKSYGLLGAERLLTDLNRLDDFRLSTDKRRLQLSKTVSLAQRLPAEFVHFRQSGRIEFDTLIDWFDEDFPGHYLRLIKSVRVSVLALVPPIDGIHGTLTNSGASTVVFPDRPPQRSLRTFGESIALDSAYNESGLFVLDYNDPMLLPFEGLGVETHWLFDLPVASNRFNFDTIADLLFTIEYTALADEAYAARVRQRLGTVRSTNGMLSLRTSFPDQWYHLQNPLDPAQPQTVTLNIPRSFFAPGLQNLILKHLTLILAPAESVTIAELRAALPQNAISVQVGGISVNIDGNATDRTNGTITTMQPGQPGGPPFTDPTFDGQNVIPFGNWEIRIAPEMYALGVNNTRNLDLIADVVIVPTVEGTISYAS